MTFTWPGMLWLLSLVPVLGSIYILVLRRRRRYAQRYSSLFRVADTLGRNPGFRRHIPMGLFLLGVTVSLLALTRPSSSIMTLAQRGTVILSIDVSGSMRAKDIKPTRMDAVKDAARTFVNIQPRGVRFGIVAFSGTAILVQPATSNKNLALAAIERLTPQMFTAIGSGLLTALDALFQKPVPEGADPSKDPVAPSAEEPPPVPPGSDSSAAIVLLSDGQSNAGPDPLEAAEKVANRGVRVFTIGVGTKEGVDMSFGVFTFHAILDEATLRKIAAITGGAYFKASTAEQLRGIYQSLGTRLELEKETTEITALFVAAAILLFIAMGVLSLAWFNRLL